MMSMNLKSQLSCTKLCSQYESNIEKMTEEIAQLKEEVAMHREEKSRSQSQEEDLNIPEKGFDDIQVSKEQVNNLSHLLKELQLRKEKHDSREMKQGLDLLLSEESKDKNKLDIPGMSGSYEKSYKRERVCEGLFCSCSKKSLCKTTKCKFRSTGGSCGPSCRCTRFKCTNREPLKSLADNELPKSENSECSTNKDGGVIAYECAKLLQSAFVEKPASRRDNQGPNKKPLCDILNSLVGNLDAQKQGRKKIVRKPLIQLVTKDTMSSTPEK